MQEPLSTRVSKTEKVLIKPVVEYFDEHADMCAIKSRPEVLFRLYRKHT